MAGKRPRELTDLDESEETREMRPRTKMQPPAINYDYKNYQHEGSDEEMEVSEKGDSMSISTPPCSQANGLQDTPREKVNPFEKHFLANPGGAMWSPSVFDNVDMSTPPQTGWSIEQMSRLFPSNFENSPSSHTNPYPLDSAEEARTQAALDQFFQGPVVPSPEESQSRNFVLPKDPILFRDCSTNTDLSFPYELPPEVEKVLQPFLSGSHGTCTSFPSSSGSTRSRSCKSGSTSILGVRRRLELSFGESEVCWDEGVHVSVAAADPLHGKHVVSSPIPSTAPTAMSTPRNQGTSRILSGEFTPTTSKRFISPDITPIRD